MTDEPTTWYLVATDDGSDEAYTTCRDAGFDLADDAGAGVILYDRTSESKLTNPYPAGPWSDEDDAASPSDELTPHELRELGRAYLADQLEAGRERGIVTRAHLAANTGAEALHDAIERYGPSTVVFPAEVKDDGGLLDKVRHNTVADLLSETDVDVVLVDADGDPTHGT